MLTFFGTIIIVYFLWLVVKPLVARYARHKFQEKVNDMFRRAYGDAFGGAAADPRREAAGTRQQAPRQPKRKIFSREDGEYIEFEEVQVSAEYTASSTSAGPGSRPHTPREPQVSDAEWEEI